MRNTTLLIFLLLAAAAAAAAQQPSADPGASVDRAVLEELKRQQLPAVAVFVNQDGADPSAIARQILDFYHMPRPRPAGE